MDQRKGGPNFEFVAPSPRLKSSVWQYFGFYKIKGSDETNFDRTLCKLCNNLLAYNSGSTTNMGYHLIRSHSIVPEGFLSNDSKCIVNAASSDKRLTPTRKQVWLDKVDEDLFEIVSAPSSLKALEWQHFGFYKIKGTNQVKMDRTWCKLCDTFTVYNEGNTKNMLSHLARHHNINPENLHSTTADSATPLPPINLNNRDTDDEEVDVPNDLNFSQDYEFVKAKPTLRALVWDYFGFYKKRGSADTKFDYTCCRLCKTLIKYIGGSTTNMRTHLQRVHHLNIDTLSSATDKSNIADKWEKSSKSIDSVDSKAAVPMTVKQLKKVLKKQSCGNRSCTRIIQLEADGSPPQFCSGCGLLLSTLLSELWTECAECCQLCGKLKDPTLDSHFCSRCGGYIAIEVEVFPHDDCEERSEKDFTLINSTDKSPIHLPEGDNEEGDLMESLPGSNESSVQMSGIDEFKPAEDSLDTHPVREVGDPSSSSNSTMSNDSSSSGFRECDFCDYRSCDMQQFKSHLKSHFDLNSASQPEMNEVDELFGGADDDQKDRLHDLIEHIKEQKQSQSDSKWDTELIDSMSVDGSNPFECYMCDFVCKHKTQLDDHVICHKNENIKRSRALIRYCRTCNEEFPTLLQLRKHEKSAACKEKMLACDECDYMTTKVDSFRGHKRRNHGTVVLKKCDYCDRMFKRQRNLDEHMNTHTGSTPFQCDKCGKAFHTNSSWYKHKRNNCESGHRERKLCSHCGREVINLRKHISDVHFNIKDYHCETCKKSFGTQYHLDRHMRIHTGEKPFPCKYCDYRASQKVVTEGHMKKCKYRKIVAEPSGDIMDNICSFGGLEAGQVASGINLPV